MKRTRLSVNLIHYFQDHRQLAKVFIKNDMQTIEDLQKHIIKLFNIEEHFYLMCQNHYLPSVEDIHILNDNDLIYVMPNLNVEQTPIVVKRKKICDENELEVKKPKKKKKKSKENNIEVTENNEVYIETNFNEEERKKKKKRQKQIDEEENNAEMMETSNIVVEADIPKKKKRKNKESIIVEAELITIEENPENNVKENTKNIVNETIIFRDSNKFDAIFTQENTTTTAIEEPQNNSTEYNFVNESRRKRRRCFSLVAPSALPDDSDHEALEANTPRKSIVQTIENINLNEHIELLKNLKDSPRQSYSLTDVLHFNHQTETSSPATNEINTLLENGSTRPRHLLRSTRKQLSGVGKVLEFIKSEQDSDEISENTDTSYPVPKRKRIRTRKRKPKNTPTTTESNEQSDQSVFIPPKTKAAPKVHIKFEDNVVDSNANSLKPSLSHFDDSLSGFSHSTPLNKTLENGDQAQRRSSLAYINPALLPILVDTPAVNNIIVFKKLKLGPDYNPTISDYILAEIVQTAKNGDELHLKIIEGHEELEDPIGGRFSCNTEDDEPHRYDYDKVQILERNTLIDPKLVDLN